MTRPRAGLLLLGAVAALFVLERRRPLRKAASDSGGRVARNAAIGAVTAAAVHVCERPIVTRVAALTELRGYGLLLNLPLPRALREALSVLLLDYTLYWWHVLLHRHRALWRLHEPHHLDRELDTSTAVRFHFAEFLASIPWRCAQILLIGADRRSLGLWQKLTLAAVFFHHSNVRLPVAIERRLSAWIVTPRLHGLHHSEALDERDTNFSSGLSVWDTLHGTALRDYKRDDIRIGLPGEPDVTLSEVLARPFTHQERAA